MTFLVERLADLRRYLAHLDCIRGRVQSGRSLDADMTLHNDVLFSLLMVCQLVIGVAGELSTRNGLRFNDYTEAVRNLRQLQEFSDELVTALEKLPGFRDVLIHGYVGMDLDRAARAVHELDPIHDFMRIAASLESSD